MIGDGIGCGILSMRRSHHRHKKRPDSISLVGAERGVRGVLSKTHVTRIESSHCRYTEEDFALKENHLLLSFPRSGSTFLRYMMEWFGRGVEVNEKPNSHDEVVNLESCFIHKGHFVKDLDGYGKIIFLIRDPFECLYSNVARSTYFTQVESMLHSVNKPQLEVYQRMMEQVEKSLTNYKCVMDRKDDVLVLSYEDLISDPMSHIRRVFDFVGETPVKEITKQEVDRITEKSHQFYHTKYAGQKMEKQKQREIMREVLEQEAMWNELNTLHSEVLSSIHKDEE